MLRYWEILISWHIMKATGYGDLSLTPYNLILADSLTWFAEMLDNNIFLFSCIDTVWESETSLRKDPGIQGFQCIFNL